MVLGCDIDDAQLPLPIHASREAAGDPELTPASFAPGAARAVVGVAVSAAPGEACPIELEALLPDASATHTLSTGRGPRSIDGEGASIACSVLEAPGTGVFDVLLSLRPARQPSFVASGRLDLETPEPPGARASGVLGLQLTTLDGREVSADCSVAADEVVRGAVWFHSLACRTRAGESGAGACDVAVSAIFELCLD